MDGYLYELNAGFFSIVVAPLFIMCVAIVIRRVESALVNLHRNGRLTVIYGDGTSRGAAALLLIRRYNRRTFSSKLLVAIVIVPAIVIATTEFMPENRGDYWRLAFGYVQAPYVQSYDGLTLSELVVSGRQINRLDLIPQSDYRQIVAYRLARHQRMSGRLSSVKNIVPKVDIKAMTTFITSVALIWNPSYVNAVGTMWRAMLHIE